jgi:copper transport protein
MARPRRERRARVARSRRERRAGRARVVCSRRERRAGRARVVCSRRERRVGRARVVCSRRERREGGSRVVCSRAGAGGAPRSRAGAVGAIAAALLVLLLAPAAASAHAMLEGTSPQRGATLREQPRAVTLRFGESVEGNFGAIRVFDSSARRVDDGHTVHPNGQGSQLAVGLRPGLAKGTYVATYRVISADSHPVSGGLVFSIGAPGATAAPTVAELIGDSRAGPATQVAFGLARGLTYLATALTLGGLAFLLAVWLPALRSASGAGEEWAQASDAFLATTRRLLLGAAVLGVASAAAGLVLQGATAGATSAWAALKPGVVANVLGTRFGAVWSARAVAFVVFAAAVGWLLRDARHAGSAAGRRRVALGTEGSAAGRRRVALGTEGSAAGRRRVALGTDGLAAGRRRVALGTHGLAAGLRRVELGADGLAAPGPPRAALALATIPAAYVAVAPALGGHASAQPPVALLFPLDVAHVLAMSAWIGGLVLLLVALPAATRRLAAPDRTRLLAATLLRFSPLALGCVVVLLVTGTIQAVEHVGAWGRLLDTGFGRAVLIKVALILALIAIGAVNRRRVIPRLRGLVASAAPPGAAGRLLRRTLRAEVALVLVVLGVTAALVSYPPPDSLAAGPFDGTAMLGPLRLEATMDPARVGANALHLYVLKAADGTPFAGTKELTVTLALPGRGIGPLPARAREAGPGHYVVDSVQLVPAGEWRLHVTSRVSDFDQYDATLRVPVR